MLALLGELIDVLELEEFRSALLGALRRVVPADWASLNDIGSGSDNAVLVIEPAVDSELILAFEQVAHENPLVAHYTRSGDGRAMRFSDVSTPEALHATALYQRIYIPLGVEHQIAFTLPAQRNRLLGVALSRGETDFTDDERDLLNCARPFLIQCYRNALEHTRLRDTTPPGLPRPAALRELGLTAREAQVLHLVVTGRTSSVAAGELGISARTVQKHLERAYRKLEVTGRVGAAQRVWALTPADR